MTKNKPSNMTSGGNPFSTKLSAKSTNANISKNNPFKTKSIREDATEGIRREFFERKHELSEKEIDKKDSKE